MEPMRDFIMGDSVQKLRAEVRFHFFRCSSLSLSRVFTSLGVECPLCSTCEHFFFHASLFLSLLSSPLPRFLSRPQGARRLEMIRDLFVSSSAPPHGLQRAEHLLPGAMLLPSPPAKIPKSATQCLPAACLFVCLFVCLFFLVRGCFFVRPVWCVCFLHVFLCFCVLDDHLFFFLSLSIA